MSNTVALHEPVGLGPEFENKGLDDLTEQARRVGIPVPVRMTEEVFNLVINISSPFGCDGLVEERKRSILHGLLRHIYRRGVNLASKRRFSAAMPDHGYVDMVHLSASLHADHEGRDCIIIDLSRWPF